MTHHETTRGPEAPAPRVVALGGGTGLPILLRGLREVLLPPGPPAAGDEDRLTALVTASDDGGSSGRLRRAYRVPPPGDVRGCLLALSMAGPTMRTLFGFRFPEGDGLRGHCLGNLILTALCLEEGGFRGALESASRLLSVRGRVLPATVEDVTLAAEFEDGSRVEGESAIPAARRPIRRVRLQPEDARPLPEALEAVDRADLVVLAPGSLYTSLIPILLIRDLTEAIRRSAARVVLIVNLMTEPGETDGYAVGDFLAAIRRHAPRLPLHVALVNTTSMPAGLLGRYAARGAAPVRPDLDAVTVLGAAFEGRDLLGDGPLARHDPRKLSRAVLELAASVPA